MGPTNPPGFRLLLLLAAALAAFSASAAATRDPVFLKNCAPCHGPDGKARNPAARKLGVKDLSKSKVDDAAIRTQILHGVMVPGGQQKMPAFDGKLTEREIQALLEIVKQFRR